MQPKCKKKKKKFVQYVEKVLWSNMSDMVSYVPWYYGHFSQIILCCGAVLRTGRCLAAPLAASHQKPIAGESRHTQNIQINEVIGENEKCVFYFMEKM